MQATAKYPFLAENENTINSDIDLIVNPNSKFSELIDEDMEKELKNFRKGSSKVKKEEKKAKAFLSEEKTLSNN